MLADNYKECLGRLPTLMPTSLVDKRIRH